MHFALLVSQLPHIEEARAHYNELLSLEPRRHTEPSHRIADAVSMLGSLRGTLGAALHAWHRHT
ncbi:hypothetical protein [Paraburkholderia sp.]|uniref:hypothetical protein n=1 Tax=Paraburkholderia sp. TaxID=1926495 RepID=UPI003D6DE0CA